jgi:hypothetical protein
MEFRDIETREAILRERERLTRERNRERMNHIRAQHEEMDRFSEDRRRARSRIRCELSELPSPDGTACSAATKAPPVRKPPKKQSSLFLAGRMKFLDSQQVRVGRFKKNGRKKATGEKGSGIFSDGKNLEDAADSADRRCCCERLERAHLRRLENRGNAPATSRLDDDMHKVFAYEGMGVNDSGAEETLNFIREEDSASDSET